MSNLLLLGVLGDYHLMLEGKAIKIYSYTRWGKGKALKQLKSNGYWAIGLWINGHATRQYVHRLVAEAIYGPCPKDMEVNHKDGNKLNNHPSNLEYITHQGNMKHAYETGLHKRYKGKNSPSYKHGLSRTREYLNECNRKYLAKKKQESQNHDDQ